MKTDRLVGIIMILLQQDKVTAPELAARFEVSVRTINRDIGSLCQAGIPIVTTQGYGGGITIAEGYKVDKSLFTEEELQTLLTGLGGMDSVSNTPYAETLIEKLSGRDRQVKQEDITTIDLASYYKGSLSEKIAMIKNAITELHIISFDYYYSKGECRRRIEPYRLVFKWSSWYVFGYCLDKQDFRLFKLNRLWNQFLEEECFAPRQIPVEELDFDEYFYAGDIHLKAVFTGSEKYRLIDCYGPDCFIPIEEEKVMFERDFADYEHMREWVLSFGDKVRVLEPVELAEDCKRQAENILKMYTDEHK
ncbi:MAG: YafY family transcriptional regulator [Lachnospiraceae bacterium]|nr:YafY family transcriptional regulator [Lachnospiraceae bacterium]